MREKFEKIIFFILIFFLPNQLGKHFWPQFSFVTGVRVDYLSPTLYVTDILILILFIVSLLDSYLVKQSGLNVARILNHLPTGVFFLFVLSLMVSTVTSKSPSAAVFGTVKLLEFCFLGFYTAYRLKKKDIKTISKIFVVNAVFISTLTIWQFAKQESIGGFFYYLGERTFNSSTIGIANMAVNGQLILRPYATFPHPNVLAFFLFFVNTFIFSRIVYEKEAVKKVFYMAVLFLSSIALFLTFSRVIILLYVLTLFYFLFKCINKKLAMFITVSVLLFFLWSSTLFYRFFDTTILLKDWNSRKELIDISISIFKEHPFFGVGLKNFFYHASLYQKTIGPTLFQPVHNIFILVLVEIGIIGFFLFCTFLTKSFQRLLRTMRETKSREMRAFYRSTFFIFSAMLIVGIFDHFFLTLQQGQLMLAVILGFAWTKMR